MKCESEIFITIWEEIVKDYSKLHVQSWRFCDWLRATQGTLQSRVSNCNKWCKIANTIAIMHRQLCLQIPWASMAYVKCKLAKSPLNKLCWATWLAKDCCGKLLQDQQGISNDTPWPQGNWELTSMNCRSNCDKRCRIPNAIAMLQQQWCLQIPQASWLLQSAKCKEKQLQWIMQAAEVIAMSCATS